MKKYYNLIVILFLLTIALNAEVKKIEIIIKNSAEIALEEYSVNLNFNQFAAFSGLNEINFIIKEYDNIVPFQIYETEKNKKIVFNINLKPKESKILELIYGDEIKQPIFNPRVYAELSMKQNDVYYEKRFRGSEFTRVKKIKVPAIHTDHDALFKFEGPGWESELVGYRFYLDWRNTSDIFGKKTNELILSTVGVHDTVAKDDSYHTMQDWGMDIFKVGNSLGIGSIGMWANNKVNMVAKTDSIFCEIKSTGPIRAEIITNYYGWLVGNNKYDLESKLSILAGSRLTKVDLAIKNAENIITGLAKHPNTEMFQSTGKGKWDYLALYGKQTLVNDQDKLGIAIFYKLVDKIETSEDDINYLIKLRPKNDKVTYYFAAAWEQEKNGIKTLEDFKKYLDDTLIRLENPVTIKIK
ncbi:MAG TPA: DUF4861 family protein [Melioribacteraceae bacterium]|nr:DUF4861 family protein [Melioribacteraceae bacterium]